MAVESKQDNKKGTSNGKVPTVDLPVDRDLGLAAKALLSDSSVRIREINEAFCKDPVLVLELLRLANTPEYSPTKTQLSIKTALKTLGVNKLQELVTSLLERTKSQDADQQNWYELQRARCRKCAVVSGMIARVAAKELEELAYTAGLFAYLGDMLAVQLFGKQYIAVARELEKRPKINFKLKKDFDFDVDQMPLQFLHDHGIPASLTSVLSRESTLAPELILIRTIYFAAVEMIDVYESGKWETLAPGRKMPAQSHLKMLTLADQHYSELYSNVAFFLSSGVLSTSKQTNGADLESLTKEGVKTETTGNHQNGNISGLHLNSRNGESEIEVDLESGSPIVIASLKESMQPDRIPPPSAPEDPRVRSEQLISALLDVCVQAQNTEELLSTVLDMLVLEGPFKKSALIVKNKELSAANAVCIAGRDDKDLDKQEFSLVDASSPLSRPQFKIESFGLSSGQDSSPFKSRAYALAPLDLKHEAPVVLYVDCGTDITLPFEARRVFRRVVEMLNDVLPELPGSIPQGRPGVQ